MTRAAALDASALVDLLIACLTRIGPRIVRKGGSASGLQRNAPPRGSRAPSLRQIRSLAQTPALHNLHVLVRAVEEAVRERHLRQVDARRSRQGRHGPRHDLRLLRGERGGIDQGEPSHRIDALPDDLTHELATVLAFAVEHDELKELANLCLRKGPIISDGCFGTGIDALKVRKPWCGSPATAVNKADTTLRNAVATHWASGPA